ncbi:MAG: hypothetical protein QOJ57_796, partial [Thermoleophilaceae bacterium]|nr:hypothetical protein [Thermoleophilaceae bacterium]
MTAREIQLAARPHGEPKDTDFRLATSDVPDPAEGEVLIRNTWMSVDPYMRGRMNDAKSYVPPFQLDAPLDGGAVGEVVASEDPSLAPGDTVLHAMGWRDYAVAPANAVRKVDTDLAPPQAYLGVLGMTGLTAYAGLIEVAGLREGDTVFVSGAAGAVGGMAGQIAKQRGHHVIGSAGSPEKVAYATGELGFDAAFDYHDGAVADLLSDAAPDGIDVYFDNVGGDHLVAALDAMRIGGRVALCGMISQFDTTGPRPSVDHL